MDQIELVRRGVDFSEPAWIIEDSAPTRPWVLPAGFDIGALSADELRVAVTLGILTVDLLTTSQRAALVAAYDNDEIPHGTAEALLLKLSASLRPEIHEN